MFECVCGIDLGTTTIKAAFIDSGGEILSLSRSGDQEFMKEHGIYGPDAERTYTAARGLIRECFEKSGVKPSRVSAVVITGQRATIIPTGKNGVPLTRAILWSDTNCEKEIEDFMNRFGAAAFLGETGLPSSALWSIGKILWVGKTLPGIFSETEKFLLITDYVSRRMGADDFVTDYSNASVTGLLNLKNLDWSERLCREAGISKEMLPVLVPSGAEIGRINRETAGASGLLEGIPLIAGGGDQQCAALGAGAVEQGDASLCLGTAAILSCPLALPMIGSSPGFFCTAGVVPGTWMLEGINNSFGAAIDWVRGITNTESGDDVDQIYGSAPPGAGGVTFFPFLSGIGSPDYEAGARGGFLGLDAAHNRGDMLRAAIEGVVMESYRTLKKMTENFGLKRIILSGGPSALNSVCSAFSSLVNAIIFRNANAETTLLGAALLAVAGNEVENLKKTAVAWASSSMETLEPGPDTDGMEQAFQLYMERFEVVRKSFASRTIS